MSQKRTAFVLAGGGSLGAVEVGMLKALAARGIRADLVIGSSVGALNAAVYAGDPTPLGLDRLARIWRGVRAENVFPLSPITAVRALLRQDNHLVNPARLRRLIEENVGYERLEHSGLPCHLMATELRTGREVRLDSGDTVEALMASTAIPAVFPPVPWDGRELVDGGVANNAPIGPAIELGAARIIVLPTGFSCDLPQPPRGALATALHSLNLLIATRMVHEVDMLGHRHEIRVIPPVCPLPVSPFDFSQTPALIDRADKQTREWIDAGGLEQSSVPTQLRPHRH